MKNYLQCDSFKLGSVHVFILLSHKRLLFDEGRWGSFTLMLWMCFVVGGELPVHSVHVLANAAHLFPDKDHPFWSCVNCPSKLAFPGPRLLLYGFYINASISAHWNARLRSHDFITLSDWFVVLFVHCMRCITVVTYLFSPPLFTLCIVSCVPDCDVTIRSSPDLPKNGTFTSPNYPQNYDNNARCYYRFVALPHERVQIRFIDFEVKGVPPR